jgi:biopolymer transport protein ExbB/biopolymer transport protein TolQ
MQFTLPELWARMGPFARFIVFVLAAMSLASMYVACERILFYARALSASKRFARDVGAAIAAGDLDDAAHREAKKDEGFLGRTMRAGLVAYENAPRAKPEVTFESVARALERQALRETQTLKRGLGVLATVASAAPFVGLLGTVMGIVTAFHQMSLAGAGGLGTVSAGISEALVTTAIGLLVAIPALVGFNGLTAWTDARSVDLSEASNELLDRLARLEDGPAQARSPGAGAASAARV